MTQSMAVRKSQQWLYYNIQHMGETLQGPTQKVKVQVCRREQGASHVWDFAMQTSQLP
jgi:hypothetical protein